MLAWEARFLANERDGIADRAAQAPTDPDGFLAWFTALESDGPGQGDPLFSWLAEAAGLQELRWFLSQEAAGEAGFDDLVALTQVKLPERAKLEMARNYWDEMGRGHAEGMHGRLLERLVVSLALPVRIDSTAWPALALGNLMVGLATRRDHTYHSIGALGVIELTAPGRVAQVAAGLRRLGVSAADRRYFDLHAVLDRKHAAGWNTEVIATLVQQDARAATWIAEGALMRLTAGARCFACYRTMLVNSPAAGR
ncbi:MAG TPA: iron-containing redox enzyme family protein [Planctomycetota bacterium]|nr:iron-containing redox enzyme family protein [Planctomycetota bacterium]